VRRIIRISLTVELAYIVKNKIMIYSKCGSVVATVPQTTVACGDVLATER